MTIGKVTSVSIEVLFVSDASPVSRVTQFVAEVAYESDATPVAKVTQFVAEVAYESDAVPAARVTQFVAEVLYTPSPAYSAFSPPRVVGLCNLVNGVEWKVCYDAGLQEIGQSLSQFAIEDRNLSTPPGSPTDGDRYIIATGGSGAWSTHDFKVATWNNRAMVWDIYTPATGWIVYIKDEAVLAVFDNSSGWSSGIAI